MLTHVNNVWCGLHNFNIESEWMSWGVAGNNARGVPSILRHIAATTSHLHRLMFTIFVR